MKEKIKNIKSYREAFKKRNSFAKMLEDINGLDDKPYFHIDWIKKKILK